MLEKNINIIDKLQIMKYFYVYADVIERDINACDYIIMMNKNVSLHIYK